MKNKVGADARTEVGLWPNSFGTNLTAFWMSACYNYSFSIYEIEWVNTRSNKHAHFTFEEYHYRVSNGSVSDIANQTWGLKSQVGISTVDFLGIKIREGMSGIFAISNCRRRLRESISSSTHILCIREKKICIKSPAFPNNDFLRSALINGRLSAPMTFYYEKVHGIDLLDRGNLLLRRRQMVKGCRGRFHLGDIFTTGLPQGDVARYYSSS